MLSLEKVIIVMAFAGGFAIGYWSGMTRLEDDLPCYTHIHKHGKIIEIPCG